jgi:hypothetical protein
LGIIIPVDDNNLKGTQMKKIKIELTQLQAEDILGYLMMEMDRMENEFEIADPELVRTMKAFAKSAGLKIRTRDAILEKGKGYAIEYQRHNGLGGTYWVIFDGSYDLCCSTELEARTALAKMKKKAGIK